VQAVRIVRLDGPAAVESGEVPDPAVADGQVLIEVHAAGVCYPEVLLTRGQYQLKPPPPFVPGSEVAGVVRSAPADSGLTVGQRVAGCPGFGGFAELVALAPDVVLPLPEDISMIQAAALPMNYLTVQFALVRRGKLQGGETVLVHGAAGGVGTAATQLAKALGARVIGVVSTAEKIPVAQAAGADDVVLSDGFLAASKELTGGRGVDVVVDPVGGERFTDSLRALATEGRLLVIGFTGGEIPTVKVNRLLLNNISVTGVGWGAFAMPRPGFIREQWAALEPHLAAGLLRPVIGATYPLAEAGKAIAALDERRAAGKIVLTTC
jgi:NADPH2:quinone reductase